MSLLWPNRLQIHLSMQGATIIGQTTASQNTLNKTYVASIEGHQAPNWQTASSSLDALLHVTPVKPNMHLSVVLSSDFIRYQLLPAQQVSMSVTEKIAYAGVAFREIYGAETDGWKFKLHDTGFNQASLAAALDEAFLQKLQQVAQQHQTKLVSVQPYLMSAYNSCRIHLAKLSGYFVVAEANQFLLLNMLQGGLQNLRTRAAGSDWEQDLKKLLQRESILNVVNGKDVLVYALANQTIHPIDGWHVRRVNVKPNQITTSGHFLGTKAAV